MCKTKVFKKPKFESEKKWWLLAASGAIWAHTTVGTRLFCPSRQASQLDPPSWWSMFSRTQSRQLFTSDAVFVFHICHVLWWKWQGGWGICRLLEIRILYPEIKTKRPRKLGENTIKRSACIVASVLKGCYQAGILKYFQILTPWPKGRQTRKTAPQPTQPKPQPTKTTSHPQLQQKAHATHTKETSLWKMGSGRGGGKETQESVSICLTS